MDLHKTLANEIASKRERDAAIAFLRHGYRHAVAGTEWEQLQKELEEQAPKCISPDDSLELYEVEGRGVGVVWPDEGMGHAWVWSGGGWREAPGLVNKSWLEGQRLPPPDFLVEFPGVDLERLETLAKETLDQAGNATCRILTPPASEIPEKDLIETGYKLTEFYMRRTHGGFADVAGKVLEGLGLTLDEALPFLPRWYNFAREELREPPATDSPCSVDRILTELLAGDFTHRPRREADAVEAFLWVLRRAVTNFARWKSRALARKVQFRLQRMPPSGIFEGHRNLWDEYCVQVQHGPCQLDSAWAATVEPIVDHLADQLPSEEAVLLTMAQRWEEDQFCEPDAGTVSADDIRRCIMAAVAELANERPHDWVTG